MAEKSAFDVITNWLSRYLKPNPANNFSSMGMGGLPEAPSSAFELRVDRVGESQVLVIGAAVDNGRAVLRAKAFSRFGDASIDQEIADWKRQSGITN